MKIRPGKGSAAGLRKTMRFPKHVKVNMIAETDFSRSEK
jgi:hypothetical protein